MRTLLAGVAIGLVIQVVTTISWMALPFHGESLRSFPHGREASVEFLAPFAEPGVYHFPGFADDMEETVRLAKEGPVVTKMVVHPGGLDPFAAGTFLLSIATNLLAGVVGAGLIAVARPRLTGLASQAGFGFGIGALICFSAVGTEAIWWAYPGAFALLTAIDHLVVWTLAGIVAPRVLPSPESVDESQ